jgi:hypothetical protein
MPAKIGSVSPALGAAMDGRLAVAKANTPYLCAKVELSEMRRKK